MEHLIVSLNTPWKLFSYWWQSAEKCSILVIDITIGHPCCEILHCAVALTNNRHWYCPETRWAQPYLRSRGLPSAGGSPIRIWRPTLDDLWYPGACCTQAMRNGLLPALWKLQCANVSNLQFRSGWADRWRSRDGWEGWSVLMPQQTRHGHSQDPCLVWKASYAQWANHGPSLWNNCGSPDLLWIRDYSTDSCKWAYCFSHMDLFWHSLLGYDSQHILHWGQILHSTITTAASTDTSLQMEMISTKG